MNRRPFLALALSLFALLGGATWSAASGLAVNETLKLPCGHLIKVLSISRVEYSKGIMALMVRYQTSLSIDEKKALSDEVDDVWKFAVKDVEKAGFSEAIISSNEVPKHFFLNANRMLSFIFEKGSDGRWTRLGRSDFMASQ